MESEMMNSVESGIRSCDNQETEQDSDGIWSTASEPKSDVESDCLSSSASNEILTVRDKTALPDADVGPSEIQQLISDAESLALERRQSLSSCSPVGLPVPDYQPSFSSENISSGARKTTPTLSAVGENLPQQQSFETDDSGYYGKSSNPSDVTLSASKQGVVGHWPTQQFRDLHASMHPERQIFQTNSKPDLRRTSNRSCEYLPRNRILPSESRSRPKASAPFPSLTQIPKETTRQSQDDKFLVTKDAKEVCNSSIKGCHDTADLESKPPVQNSNTRPPVQNSNVTVSTFHNNSEGQDSLAKEVSSLVLTDCNNLLRLAMTSTSNFGRVMRLLRQMMTLQFGSDTPRVSESIHKELEEYEKQYSSLQSELSSTSSELQSTFGQVQALESCLQDIQKDRSAVGDIALSVLQQIEETLTSCGLHHMIAVTSPRRRSVVRTLEDTESALTLLLGELNRKTAHCRNLENEFQCQEQECESLQNRLIDRESRLLAVKRELESLKDWSNSEITSLKHCLAQIETHSAEVRLEKDRVGETFKRLREEDTVIIKKLQKQVVDLQHSQDSRASIAENCVQELTKEKLVLESELQEMQNKLTVQEQQLNLTDEEHKLLVAGLRSTIKHQQAESERIRSQLDHATTEKASITKQLESLANELSKEQESQQKLQDEVSALMNKIGDLKQDYKDSETTLHSKVDNLTAKCCDLERVVRAKDLTILQLQTELKMDGQHINALTEDNNNLLQKAQSLQERLWDATRRRRHGSSNSSRTGDEYYTTCGTPLGRRLDSEIGSLSNLAGVGEGSLANQKVKNLEKNVSDGQSREEHLHKLLIEKDEAIKNLQNSITTELADKNKELESLRNKLPELEEQMESLLTAMEVNEAMGQVTTKVGRHLQERQEHLENLDKSSNILKDEYTALVAENQSLRSKLSTCKQVGDDYADETYETARRAKEEARQERLAAARLEQKCTTLQVQLNSTISILEQERREREMRDMVQQLKHESFEAVLNSTVSSGIEEL